MVHTQPTTHNAGVATVKTSVAQLKGIFAQFVFMDKFTCGSTCCEAVVRPSFLEGCIYLRRCCGCGRPAVAAPIIWPLKPHPQIHNFGKRNLHACVGPYRNTCAEFTYVLLIYQGNSAWRTKLLLKARTSIRSALFLVVYLEQNMIKTL